MSETPDPNLGRCPAPTGGMRRECRRVMRWDDDRLVWRHEGATPAGALCGRTLDD